MNAAETGVRIAICDAPDAFCTRLRARFGLAPGGGASLSPRGLGYCGREFRAYPSMRIADAVRFYAALHARWNGARLREHLALAGLEERFEIGRMKRAFQRTLVLVLALAPEPDLLVVENAEEFDEERPHALLQRAVDVVPRVVVTYAAGVTLPLAGLAPAIDAARYEAGHA